MYVDTHVSGLENMATRDDKYFIPAGYLPLYHNGTYANWDRIDKTGLPEYSLNVNRENFIADYHMTGDEYTDQVINLFTALNDSIDAADMPAMYKQQLKGELEVELAIAATDFMRQMQVSYWSKNDGWGKPVPSDSIKCKLSSDNVRKFAEKIDFNDPYIYLSPDALDALNTDIWRANGIDAGIYEYLRAYSDAYARADKGEFTSVPADLAKAPEGFTEDLKAHAQYMKDKLASLDFSLVTPTPDVPAENSSPKSPSLIVARWLWLTSGTLGVAPAVRLWPRTSLPRARNSLRMILYGYIWPMRVRLFLSILT